jgi:hypothetical protein
MIVVHVDEEECSFDQSDDSDSDGGIDSKEERTEVETRIHLSH